MDPSESVGNYRPAGYSDSDSDFSSDEPIQPFPKYVMTFSLKERFQSIVIQGKFPEFETMIREELNNEVDYRFENEWTPLMFACFHGQPQMLDYLLDRNADPNAHADSTTPLMFLCFNGFGSDQQIRYMASKLLDRGAILNMGDKHGMTPLMRAIECARSGLVKLMTERNANIEMRDRQGWTAVFWAVHTRHTPILVHLISLGARLTEVDRWNRTILDIAEAQESQVILKLIEPYFNKHNIEEYAYMSADPNYWLEYYPGLRKNNRYLYQEELVNLLYGMNCDNLRPYILKNGIDLGSLLLLEEKDMIKLGINMQFERRRLKQGIRSFHLRNWKLKSVSGLYSRQDEDFSILDCLEITGNMLMQLYILEVSLRYVIREFNKIRNQINESDQQYVTSINESIKNWIINIDKIKKEIVEMNKLIKIIQDRSPKPVELDEEPNAFVSMLQASVIGAVTFSLGYVTYRVVLRCVTSVSK